MSVVGVVVIGCFLALFARLWYLQIIEAPELEQLATTNRERTVAVSGSSRSAGCSPSTTA
jgi:cell division protein FtsI/penicillin-binding protein 2